MYICVSDICWYFPNLHKFYVASCGYIFPIRIVYSDLIYTAYFAGMRFFAYAINCIFSVCHMRIYVHKPKRICVLWRQKNPLGSSTADPPPPHLGLPPKIRKLFSSSLKSKKGNGLYSIFFFLVARCICFVLWCVLTGQCSPGATITSNWISLLVLGNECSQKSK